jgi:hypothetical protein
VATAVARGALAKLRGDVVDAFNSAIDRGQKPHTILHAAVRAYWTFARKRPRHFHLAFSPDLSGDRQVKERRESVRVCMETTVKAVLDDESAAPKAIELWALVHGAACMLTMGKDLSEDHLLKFIDAHVVVLDAAPRHS